MGTQIIFETIAISIGFASALITIILHLRKTGLKWNKLAKIDKFIYLLLLVLLIYNSSIVYIYIRDDIPEPGHEFRHFIPIQVNDSSGQSEEKAIIPKEDDVTIESGEIPLRVKVYGRVTGPSLDKMMNRNERLKGTRAVRIYHYIVANLLDPLFFLQKDSTLIELDGSYSATIQLGDVSPHVPREGDSFLLYAFIPKDPDERIVPSVQPKSESDFPPNFLLSRPIRITVNRPKGWIHPVDSIN